MNLLDEKIEELLDSIERSNAIIQEIRKLCDDYIKLFGEL